MNRWTVRRLGLAAMIGWAALYAGGCGEPAPAAPPPPVTAFVADAKLTTEQQGLAFARHLQAKLEAKDYRWFYEHVLPPEEARAYQQNRPLADFVREFADSGEAEKMLKALKTIKVGDVAVDREDPDRVVIAWKDSWPSHQNLVFVRIEKHWYLSG